MIHHISIAAYDPLHVAAVLAEIWNGKVYNFTSIPGAYITTPYDDHGSAIEIFPMGTEIVLGTNGKPHEFVQGRESFRFVAVHAAISVPISQEQIEQIGAREGWRVQLCDRGPFKVIEFWLENWLMLEFLPPEFAREYLEFTNRPQIVEQVLGLPIERGRALAETI